MGALNADAKSLRENTCSRCMIQMAVRQQNLFYLDAGFLDYGKDAINVATWINHYGLLCLVTDQQGAILLERRNGNDGVFHFRQYTRG